ncbi:MAG: type II secretion system protein GspN [Bdellovibrionaceae bacterium]|nr:type II secretion system protein GspN [Pseudobdellovibrionaceae bacterium]
MEQLRPLLVFLARQWKKYVVAIFLTAVFIVLMFPLNDVGDLVTTQVYKGTGNKVYLQFEDLNLDFLPSPGLEMSQISLEASPLPPLAIRRLEVRPSLFGLLMQKIDASATAEGIFRGDIRASIKPGRKMENGAASHAITLNAERLSLAEVKKLVPAPVNFRGVLNLNADGQIDPSFTNQPDVTIDLNSQNFELLPSTVETMMGPLSVPELKLGRLNLKGRLSAGSFVIEDGQLGQPNDELTGTVKGRLGLEMRLVGNGMVVPVATNYEFNVNLVAKKSFEDRASMFLLLIQNHRQPEADGGRYRFTLTGDARSQQFQFNPAR